MKPTGRNGLLAAMAMAFAAMANGETELVRNGSFDEQGGWNPTGLYSFDSRGGQNGTGGLRWENTDPKKYQICSQSLGLKKGVKYRYSCWVKMADVKTTVSETDRVKPLNAAICVAWNDTDGKWIGEVAQALDDFHARDWRFLKGETPPMPPNAASYSVSLYVNRGCTGRIWFDDVSVTPVEQKPVSFVTSSVYRDMAATGDVEFRAVLKIDSDRMPLNRMKAVFSYVGENGRVTVEAGEFSSETAMVRLPVESLVIGTNRVVFSLKGQDGAIFDSGTIDFTRMKELPPRRCYIDVHKRLIVDGKPFFPLGMFISHVAQDVLDPYCKGPWNCVLPYCAGDKVKLDMMAEKGLKVIYGLSDEWANFGKEKRFRTDDEAQAHCRKRVLSLKDHPSIIAWYVLDEMPLKFMPRMLARQKMMCEIDPNHPTYGVFFQYYQIREYIPVCDILSTDPYPIASEPISLPTDHMRTINSATFGYKATWQVPQAFDWGWFVSRKDEPNRCRLPTYEEARTMTWQAIAGGANGIVYWAYHYIQWRLKGEDYEKFYGQYCKVGEEVKKFIPVILSVEPCAKVVRVSKGASARAWSSQGKTYLLVCNTTREPIMAKVVLDTPFSAAVAALDKTEPAVSGRDIACQLASMGVTVLRLE